MDGLYGYQNRKVVRVPMPRTTNHVVMSIDSDHKLLTNVGASRVRQSPVTVRGRTIVRGNRQEEVRPEGQQPVLRSQRVERAEAEAGLVRRRWKFQQAVEKSPMRKVLSEKW